MQTNPLPEIEESDLKAAREFLSVAPEEKRRSTPVRPSSPPSGAVTVHKGITRARFRSAPKGTS